MSNTWKHECWRGSAWPAERRSARGAFRSRGGDGVPRSGTPRMRRRWHRAREQPLNASFYPASLGQILENLQTQAKSVSPKYTYPSMSHIRTYGPYVDGIIHFCTNLNIYP